MTDNEVIYFGLGLLIGVSLFSVLATWISKDMKKV